jgi:hypothetical protein
MRDIFLGNIFVRLRLDIFKFPIQTKISEIKPIN